MKGILVAVACVGLTVLGLAHASPGPWSVGAGAILAPNPYLNSKTNVLPIPIVSYQDKNISWYGPLIKLRHFIDRQNIIGVLGVLDTRIFDPNDTSNAQLKVLNKRDRQFLVGGYYRHKASYGDMSLSVTGDVTGTSNGFFGEANYSYPFYSKDRRYYLRPEVGLQWSDSKIIKHFYGVSAQESLISGLPTYSPSATVAPFVSLFSGITLWRQLSWFTILRASYIPNDIHDSPMVSKTRTNVSALTGLTWAIGSPAKA